MRAPKAADMSGVAHGVSSTHVQSKMAVDVETREARGSIASDLSLATTWSESLASPLKLRRQACAWCQRVLPFARVLGRS